ncbi:YrdB family protein [Kitasatospora sp. NPDC048365]|uniref:YrdB family protein n=1 Tax=Kitasatospora sp. NPDC048365 TaxID=3364050 RepID=UPI0037198804
MRGVLTGVNLVGRFLLELAALAALAVGGYAVPGPTAVRVLVALALPVGAAVLWGRYAAPKRSVPDAVAAWYLTQAVVWGGAVAALALSGHGTWAVVLAVLMAVNTVALWALGEWSPSVRR